MKRFLVHPQAIYFTINIGTTHVFSCINMCQVSRKVFEHEANRTSAQTSTEGPGKCLYNETNMCDRYSCIFNLIPTKFALKTTLLKD